MQNSTEGLPTVPGQTLQLMGPIRKRQLDGEAVNLQLTALYTIGAKGSDKVSPHMPVTSFLFDVSPGVVKGFKFALYRKQRWSSHCEPYPNWTERKMI